MEYNKQRLEKSLCIDMERSPKYNVKSKKHRQSSVYWVLPFAYNKRRKEYVYVYIYIHYICLSAYEWNVTEKIHTYKIVCIRKWEFDVGEQVQ